MVRKANTLKDLEGLQSSNSSVWLGIKALMMVGIVVNSCFMPIWRGLALADAPYIQYEVLSTAFEPPRRMPDDRTKTMSMNSCMLQAARSMSAYINGKVDVPFRGTYVAGWNSKVTAIITCFRIKNDTVAVFMITAEKQEDTKSLLGQLMAEFRFPPDRKR